MWRTPDKPLSGRLDKTSTRLRRILIHISKEYLEEFDRETSGLYASRSEAIRAGVIMVLETIKRKPNTEGENSNISYMKQDHGKRRPGTL